MFSRVDVSRVHYSQLLDLNESCVPHVNSIGLEEMASFRAQCNCFFLAEEEGRIAGFVIALEPGCDYNSLNYIWFQQHFEQFLYVDRIMVHPEFRRRGVASWIYEQVESVARQKGIPRITCEVNVRPPNPDSLKMHLGLGFKEAERQTTEQGQKEVALLVRTIDE